MKISKYSNNFVCILTLEIYEFISVSSSVLNIFYRAIWFCCSIMEFQIIILVSVLHLIPEKKDKSIYELRVKEIDRILKEV